MGTQRHLSVTRNNRNRCVFDPKVGAKSTMDIPLQVDDLERLSSSSSTCSTGTSDVSIDNKLLAESACQAGRSFTDDSIRKVTDNISPRIVSREITPVPHDMSRNGKTTCRSSSPQVESVVKKDGTQEKSTRTNKDRDIKDREMEEMNYDNETEKYFESMAASFMQANDTSDLRLVCEGKPLYVSRIVLSIISPVLKQMFDQRSREQSVIEIVLPGKSFHDILELLCCVYPDKLKPVTGE